MKTISRIILLLLLPIEMSFAWANCDLTSFPAECEIYLKTKPTRAAHSLVYCGNTTVYVTHREYDILARYQRADVNMILTADDEYIDSPCVPGER